MTEAVAWKDESICSRRKVVEIILPQCFISQKRKPQFLETKDAS
jgi:hypothetical protein